MVLFKLSVLALLLTLYKKHVQAQEYESYHRQRSSENVNQEEATQQDLFKYYSYFQQTSKNLNQANSERKPRNSQNYHQFEENYQFTPKHEFTVQQSQPVIEYHSANGSYTDSPQSIVQFLTSYSKNPAPVYETQIEDQPPPNFKYHPVQTQTLRNVTQKLVTNHPQQEHYEDLSVSQQLVPEYQVNSVPRIQEHSQYVSANQQPEYKINNYVQQEQVQAVSSQSYVHHFNEKNQHRSQIAEHSNREDCKTDFDDHPRYEYSYSVNDPHTGDKKSLHETRDGHLVKGVYSLHEADGTVRTVEYTADEHTGYNAHVIKSATHLQAGHQ